MKDQKTFREWFETLPEPYRSQAIYNGEKDDEEGRCNVMGMEAISLSNAIFSGFYWHKSPEGQKYWSDFSDKLQNNE